MNSNKLNQIFCCTSLAEIRKEAKKINIKLPKMEVYRSTKSNYFEVFLGGHQCALNMSLTKGIIWRGEAYNNNDAKTAAVKAYVEKYLEIQEIIKNV